jgi:hypothetical protein
VSSSITTTPTGPHRSLELVPPAAIGSERTLFVSSREVIRRDRLGGLIHEYSHAA